jgi:hypothetical protein
LIQNRLKGLLMIIKRDYPRNKSVVQHKKSINVINHINRMKDKNHTVTLEEKHLTKFTILSQ